MKKMMMSKKNIVILTAALLACMMVGGATLALLTGKTGTLTNSFSVAKVESHIEEEINSTTMTKKPSVVNDGDAECLVRMKVTVTPSDAEGEKGLFTLNYQTSDVVSEGVTPWKYNESDGYWYYQGILKEGGSTTALFTTVQWNAKNSDGSNDYSNFEEFDIILYQETIQTHAGDVSALVDGEYNQEAALKVWAAYAASSTTTETTESSS